MTVAPRPQTLSRAARRMPLFYGVGDEPGTLTIVEATQIDLVAAVGDSDGYFREAAA
jgi:hypothetical protein